MIIVLLSFICSSPIPPQKGHAFVHISPVLLKVLLCWKQAFPCHYCQGLAGGGLSLRYWKVAYENVHCLCCYRTECNSSEWSWQRSVVLCQHECAASVSMCCWKTQKFLSGHHMWNCKQDGRESLGTILVRVFCRIITLLDRGADKGQYSKKNATRTLETTTLWLTFPVRPFSNSVSQHCMPSEHGSALQLSMDIQINLLNRRNINEHKIDLLKI